MLARHRTIGRQVGPLALRLVGAVGLALYFACAFTPLPSLLSQWQSLPPAIEPADAIVVLGGGGVRDDGQLTDSSLRRTLHGIGLYQQRLAPLIVFSGWRYGRTELEAEVRAALARRVGIEPGAILTESRARTTHEEALRCAGLLQPRGVRTILLVGDAQGSRRAAGVFRKVGFRVLPAPADDVSGFAAGPEDRLELMRRVAMEAIALIYYRLAGYL